MENFWTVIAVAFALIFVAAVMAQRIRIHRELRTRRRLEAEIISISDDLTTNSDGLSLRDVVDLLETPMIEEILLELRRMPAGSRRLQRAIEITGNEGYGKTA